MIIIIIISVMGNGFRHHCRWETVALEFEVQ